MRLLNSGQGDLIRFATGSPDPGRYSIAAVPWLRYCARRTGIKNHGKIWRILADVIVGIGCSGQTDSYWGNQYSYNVQAYQSFQTTIGAPKDPILWFKLFTPRMSVLLMKTSDSMLSR
jgi:hypothetical protein